METAPIHSEISAAPTTAKGYMARASDGVPLRVGVWETAKPCHGTVLFFPGRGDYIELYGLSRPFNGCVYWFAITT